MLALILLIVLPIIFHTLFFSFHHQSVNGISWSKFSEAFCIITSSILVLMLAGPTELITSGQEEFFRINLILTPFRSTMIAYLLLAYCLSLFANGSEETSTSSYSFQAALILSFAQALVLAQNFYSVLIFCTGMTVSLLVANRSSSPAIRGNSVHFYLRKELSDFFLILGLLLLSFNLSVHDFTTLEQMLEEGNPAFANFSIILVSLWFFTRLRIFPFISIRQSYFRSIDERFQLIFMSIYLPAIVLTYCSFAACLINIPLARNILLIAGLASVIIYSLLSIISRRLETAQNFFAYAHYGLIPLGLALGMSSGLIFHFIYMCILMTVLIFSLSRAKRLGISTVIELSVLKNSNPYWSWLIVIILFLLLGLPFIGVGALKFEMIWNILNQENNLGTLFALIATLLLLAIATLKFIVCILKPVQVLSGNKLPFTSAILLFAIATILVAIGLIHAPMNIKLIDIPALASYLAPGITDARIIFQPSWVAYLTMGMMLVVPALLFGGILMLMRHNIKIPNIFDEQSIGKCLEIYIRLRSRSYDLSKNVSNWFQSTTSRLVREIELMGHKLFLPIIETNRTWSKFINRYEVQSFHGHMIAILFAMIIMCSLVYYVVTAVGVAQ